MLKKYIRAVAVLLVAVMGVLTLASCGEDDSSNGSVNLGYGGNYQMIIDSVDEINCDYLLVYRSTVGYTELDAYINFLEVLSASSTASFQICPDTLNITDASQKIILLGNTIYGDSIKTKSIMQSIRANNYYDYLLCGYKNTLCINWMSKFGREGAFQYLLDELLNSDFDKAFKSNYSYMYLSDRSDTPVVTIDDVNIIQYSVIVSSSPSFIERQAAERLVRVIKAATGVDVPLVTDTVEESTYEILVGSPNRGQIAVTSFFSSTRYALAQYSTKMILRGGHIEATAKAVSVFADLIENASITAEPLHIKSGYTKTGNVTNNLGNVFDGYNVVFSDEFNTAKLDSKWSAENGAISGYGDAAALMYFNSKNIKTNGSEAIIRTQLTNVGYSSGHLSTDKSFSFQYGYVETRAKFRAVPGVWLKMYLTDQFDNRDTISQIDVFNSLSGNDSIFASAGTLESKTYYSNYLKLIEPSYETYRSGTFENELVLDGEQYHTYGVEWTPEYIRYFIDGVSYGTVEVSAAKYNGLKTEMYLDFIVGVGLTETETIDEVAMWPLDMCIDWVRVYQKPGQTFTDRTVISE